MFVSKERLLALSTDKVFHVPLLAKGSDHSLLDWSATGTTDGNAHFVMTPQTVQFTFHFTCAWSQLDTTSLAVEVVWVVSLALWCDKHKLVPAKAIQECKDGPCT